jgi:hypothetical protein
MEKIYSKIEHLGDALLHVIFRREDFHAGRINVIEEYENLQCAALNLPKGTTFKPHWHIIRDVPAKAVAQESWVVIQGSVKVIFYDQDHTTIIYEGVLHAGDASFTLYGGHNYEILEENTLVYEMKTGPYYGQDKDKRFIE